MGDSFDTHAVKVAPDEHRRPPAKVFDVVILGAGAAGTAVADGLHASPYPGSVAMIDPSAYSYDQPDWIDVGTHGVPPERTRYRRHVPGGVTWLRDRVVEIDPETQRVQLDRNGAVAYTYLVVALGVEMRWNRIRGAREALHTPHVCSVYGYKNAERAWTRFRDFTGGRAIFTAPSGPYKGAATPLRVLQRVASLWRDRGVLSRADLYFSTAWTQVFSGVEAPPDTLSIRGARETHLYAGYDLVEVRDDRQEAVFAVEKGASRSEEVIPFDLLHIAPPMRPPDVIENSILAYPMGPMRGFLEVREDTLRHPVYPSVFGVGDVIGIESVKTAEAARDQAQTVVEALVGSRS